MVVMKLITHVADFSHMTVDVLQNSNFYQNQVIGLSGMRKIILHIMSEIYHKEIFRNH